ncbi:potassium-transporting ATPase subunit KdpC [Mycetocola sp. JXN-3]|uniref:potassium-transporting ATPase subunit KdpC n=1 Tax=Mycetocola sp. JXN-3 TaxID=2116510 RepID=UPI00165D10D1|nr:potassium-transporting ATPase subunit KdpC [Mycetocola sp. JXN-3]
MSASSSLRSFGTALRTLLVLTVLLGILYPAAILLVGRAMPAAADGSLVSDHGKVVGSSLIGQDFTGDTWFNPRPSAGKYDALNSGASNLAPTSKDLAKQIDDLRAQVAKTENVSPEKVPADALTASASGLDPDISPEYARLQSARVAAARHLSEETVARLVREHTEEPLLGFIGVPTVNVLELNLALEHAAGSEAQ